MRNNGGSPSGVNDPPIFATKKIKYTRVLYVFDLYWLGAGALLKAWLRL